MFLLKCLNKYANAHSSSVPSKAVSHVYRECNGVQCNVSTTITLLNKFELAYMCCSIANVHLHTIINETVY